MTKVLNITSNPQTFNGGTYAAAASIINTKRWQIVVTPTAASSTFTGGVFHVIFGQSQGGLSFVDQALEMDDTADNLMFSQALTWSGGQQLTFTIDTRAGSRSVTIAGATTGNGTFTYTSAAAICAAGTNLEIGNVGGSFTLAATIGPIDDLAPDDSWIPVLPNRQLRRAPAALIVAAMTAPVLTIPNPLTPLSWAPITPDYQLRSARPPLNVGGMSMPDAVLPNADSPPLAWAPIVPAQQLRAARAPVLVGGSTAPEATLANSPAPAMSWAPLFPDFASRPRAVVNVGGSFAPEATLPNLLPPGMSWAPTFPDFALRRRQPHHSSLIAPPFAGGPRLTTGAMVVRQNILGGLAFSTPLTTFGTDITFTAAAGTTLTATAHLMVNCAGPFTVITTGTLPGGLTAGTLYYCAQPTANTFHLATSAANADTGTFVSLADGGTGTHTLLRVVNTAPLYSTFVSIISRGTQAASPNLPTDNYGNTFAYAAGTPSNFSGFPDSAFSVAVVIGGKGGLAHTFSTSIGNIGGGQDEVLASGLEIFDARILQDSSNVEKPDGGAAIITSNPVTTTARALLVAIIGGNSNVGQENFWIFFDGFTKLPRISAEGDIDAAGYDQMCAAARYVDIPGTYTFSAQGTVRGGGGPSGGKLILLAFQAQSSDLPPFDWLYPLPPNTRRPRPSPYSGETAPPSQLGGPTVPPLSWAPTFPDTIARARRGQLGGETAPPGDTNAGPRTWAPVFPDRALARPRALLGGETAPPADTNAGPLTWLPKFPDRTSPIRRAALAGESAPVLVPAAAPPLSSWAPTFPDFVTRAQRPALGGTAGPVLTIANPAAPPLDGWLPIYPDSTRRGVLRISGGATAPEATLPNAPAPALSWNPVYPERAIRARSVVIVGGPSAPEAVLPDLPALVSSWTPVLPSHQLRIARGAVLVGGMTSPDATLPNQAPSVSSWLAVYPGFVLRPRSVVLVGGASAPEATLPNAPAPAMSWAPTMPAWQLRRAASAVLVGGVTGPDAVLPNSSMPLSAFAQLVADMDRLIIQILG